jgi:hypothetical protein
MSLCRFRPTGVFISEEVPAGVFGFGSSAAFKLVYVMWGGTASTSSRQAGRIAYAGSSGRIEERLRRRFRGYSSAANRGLRPDAAYVLACTRSRSLALAWEAWLHRPPYVAKTPAKRPRKPPHPPPGWYAPRNAVYKPSRPRRPADTAPSPAAEAQAQSQDVGRGERRRSQLSEDVSCSNSVAAADCEER